MKTSLSNPVKLILLMTALLLAGELINAQTFSDLSRNKKYNASLVAEHPTTVSAATKKHQ